MVEVLNEQRIMTENSSTILKVLANNFPEFEKLVSVENNLITIDKPSDTNAQIGGLVIQTTKDNEIWVRIYQPFSAYSVDNLEELLEIIKGVFADEILWVTAFNGMEWYETTLIQNIGQLELEPGIVYNVFSWSGKLDKTVAG